MGRGLDLPGLLTLSPAVLALVVPLVLGQPEHWPAWGWASLAGSVALFALCNGRAEAGRPRRVPAGSRAHPAAARGGAGHRGLFAVMTTFGGLFFTLALHLQGGLGDSPLRAGLVFAPSAAAFAVVSLNWQRLPARVRPRLAFWGFTALMASLLALAALIRGGGSGGIALYLVMGVVGAAMALAFSPLMTSVLMLVPVPNAADATGVIVTVNQLGLVIGVATLGTLYLNLAGALPRTSPRPRRTRSGLGRRTRRPSPAWCLAGAAAVGAILAQLRVLALRDGR